MIIITENVVDFLRVRRILKDSDSADNLDNAYKKYFKLWGGLSRMETMASRKILEKESLEVKVTNKL